MILQRLFELAQREHLLQDPAFVRTAVACQITIDASGRFLGLIDLRQRIEVPAKGKKGKAKVVVKGGKDLLVPVRPVQWDERKGKWKTTDPAAAGKEKPAVFLCDTIARVLPVERLIQDKDRAKFQAQRATFWHFLQYAAERTQDEALESMARFSEQIQQSSGLQEDVAAEVERLGLSLANLCTFARNEDGGATVLERQPIQDWWRSFFAADFEVQEEGQRRGPCQVTQRISAIASSIKSKINGLVPIGCRADAYLVTGLPSSESYELEGPATGMVSATGVDGFTRALNALIANELGGRTTSYRVGKVLFLFWTREPVDTGFMNLFEPDETQVEALLHSVHGGIEYRGMEKTNDFYLLVLSGNSARVVVRDYLETKLPKVRDNLAAWFKDLRIADAARDGAGAPSSRFPLWQLALATAMESDQVAPDTGARLLRAALTGGPVSDSILAACLRRLRVEGNDGFRPARMALVKLCLNRLHCIGETRMTEILDRTRINDHAYVCGQLLAFLARCQSPKDFGSGAQILERFFGSASSSPRGVLPTLLRLNRHHIAKIRDENPGFAFNLEAELEQLLLPLKSEDSTPDFPIMLSLPQQGRFALGFYHQRAEYRRISEENKAAKLAKSETK